jgi:hypothetical protein
VLPKFEGDGRGGEQNQGEVKIITPQNGRLQLLEKLIEEFNHIPPFNSSNKT